MAYVKERLVHRSTKKKGRVRYDNIKSKNSYDYVYLVKDYGDTKCGILIGERGFITFPLSYIGKRVILKVEVLE